jgi:hypothetical protein
MINLTLNINSNKTSFHIYTLRLNYTYNPFVARRPYLYVMLKTMNGDKSFYYFKLSIRFNYVHSIDVNRRARLVLKYAVDERYKPSMSHSK